MPARPRRGFSLIELVVVLLVILLLAALILPSMSSAGGSARRVQCLNHARNIGLAIQNYAAANAGLLPVLEDGRHGWPVNILRQLDQPALIREMSQPDWSDEKAPHLQILTCPNDSDSFQTPGGLSYAVNAGYGHFPVDRRTGAITERGTHSLSQNWDEDAEVSEQDRLVTKATGLFWRLDESVEPMTIDFIAENDGTGGTLLLTENLHAGPWTTRVPLGLAFVIGRDRLVFDPAAGPLALKSTNLGPFAIAASKGATAPAPAPSSNHPGSVNVIWADGRGGALADSIDPTIYVRIVTPAGTPHGQHPVDDDPT